jgi:hypothetical protein
MTTSGTVLSFGIQRWGEHIAFSQIAHRKLEDFKTKAVILIKRFECCNSDTHLHCIAIEKILVMAYFSLLTRYEP